MKEFRIFVFSIWAFLSTFLGLSYGSNQGNDTSQDIYEMRRCPLRLDTKLPGINCSNPYCGEITCSALFSLKNFTLTMRISQVDDRYRYLSAYVTLSVPELRFDWFRSFKDGEKAQVPRFPLKVKGFEGADVFLQVYLKKENGTIHFKVDLHANWRNLTTERTYSTTIFAGKTPEDGIMTMVICRFGPYPDDGDDHERPTHKRLKVLPTFAKVLIAMAVCALILFLIVFATFYYFKKKTPTAVKVKPTEPPSYEEATSTKTKAPIQPQINHV